MSIELTQAETNTASIDPMLATEIKPRPLSYSLNDYHLAGVPGSVLHAQWQDKPHRLLYDLIAAVAYYAGKQPTTGEPVWFHKNWGEYDDIFYRPNDVIPDGSTPLYTTPQPAQATQAEVTDEQILSLDCVSIDSDEHGTSFWVDRSTVIKFARAILALRPVQVPMTPDEIVNARNEVQAHSIVSFAKGVRAAEAHHFGITAQAKKETP